MHIVRKQTQFRGATWILLATVSLSLMACGGTGGRRDRRLFDARFQQGVNGYQQPFQATPQRTHNNTFFQRQPDVGPFSSLAERIRAQQARAGGETIGGPTGRQAAESSGASRTAASSGGAEHGDLGLNRTDVSVDDLWETICYGPVEGQGPSTDGDTIPPECEKYLQKQGYILAHERHDGNLSQFPNGYLVGVRAFNESDLRRNLRERLGNWIDVKKDDRDLYKKIEAIANGPKKDNAFLDLLKKGGRGLGLLGPEYAEMNKILAARLALETKLRKYGNAEEKAQEHRALEHIRDIFEASDDINITRKLYDEGFPFLSRVKDGVTWVRGGASEPLIMNTLRPRDEMFRLSDFTGVDADWDSISSYDSIIYMVEADIYTPTELEVAIHTLKGARSAGIFVVLVDGNIVAHTIDFNGADKKIKEALGKFKMYNRGTISKGELKHLQIALIMKEPEEGQEDLYIRENVFVRARGRRKAEGLEKWNHLPQAMATIMHARPYMTHSTPFAPLGPEGWILLDVDGASPGSKVTGAQKTDREESSAEGVASATEDVSTSDYAIDIPTLREDIFEAREDIAGLPAQIGDNREALDRMEKRLERCDLKLATGPDLEKVKACEGTLKEAKGLIDKIDSEEYSTE